MQKKYFKKITIITNETSTFHIKNIKKKFFFIKSQKIKEIVSFISFFELS